MYMDGDFAKSLKGKLDPEQYDICVNKGTEPAFTGKYHDSKELGTYRCVCCNVVLFKSDKKFNSGTGWPSFSDVIDKENIEYIQDSSFGMLRTEANCCGKFWMFQFVHTSLVLRGDSLHGLGVLCEFLSCVQPRVDCIA